MANVGQVLQSTGRALGNALTGVAQHSAKAAAAANGISFASQAAQGNFNQASANNANEIANSRIAQQYAYNSAAAADANAFTQMMWDKAAAYNTESWERAAAWNESMMEKQMHFNAEQAELNRAFQKEMDSTKYQRAIHDMKSAGLNPILAVTGGGVSAGGAGGSTASVGAPSMSSAAGMGGATGQMPSGGLLNGISASEGNFTGQMEYMSGTLGLISAVIGGMSSAFQGLGSLGDMGKGLGEALGDVLDRTLKQDKKGGYKIDWGEDKKKNEENFGILGQLYNYANEKYKDSWYGNRFFSGK